MVLVKGSEERIDETTLRVTRVSLFSGKTHTKDLFITAKAWSDWCHGVLIQEAMPGLSDADREFLMTGTTQEEWDTTFGKEEDE